MPVLDKLHTRWLTNRLRAVCGRTFSHTQLHTSHLKRIHGALIGGGKGSLSYSTTPSNKVPEVTRLIMHSRPRSVCITTSKPFTLAAERHKKQRKPYSSSGVARKHALPRRRITTINQCKRLTFDMFGKRQQPWPLLGCRTGKREPLSFAGQRPDAVQFTARHASSGLP